MTSKKDIKEQIQYWWSKYCNSIMRDEKEVFLNLSNSYKQLYEYLELHNIEMI